MTIGNPVGDIYSGMNLTNIRRAIKTGRLVLINGSLSPDPTPYKLVAENGKYKLAIQRPKRKVNDTDKKVVQKVETKIETEEPIETPIKIIPEVTVQTKPEPIQDFLNTTEKVSEENISKSEKKKKNQKKDIAEAES